MRERVLTGRSAIVTGASMGIGRAIARAYAGAGAHLLLCARGEQALASARKEIEAVAAPGQIVAAEPADVSSEDDVSRLRARAETLLPSLEIVVNAAGVLGPIGAAEDADPGEWRRTLEVNVMGAMLLCRAFVPRLRRQRYGKIVQLAGGGATGPDPRFAAYAASKAAVVRFAETLARELWNDGVDVNAVAPGDVLTRMNDARIGAGPERAGLDVWRESLRRRERGGADPRHAAELAVFLASAASDGLSGKLVSALRDPWREFGSRIQELRDSDLYTLRRTSEGAAAGGAADG